jgi:tetratricopeptide (TPR) repeat protein
MPGNPSFQDTYGWILYKMGKYQEAKSWIEKSMAGGSSNSAVVLEHYGDVLYKLGSTEKALEFWIKAKNAGEEGSEFLEKKINEKKLYE